MKRRRFRRRFDVPASAPILHHLILCTRTWHSKPSFGRSSSASRNRLSSSSTSTSHLSTYVDSRSPEIQSLTLLDEQGLLYIWFEAFPIVCKSTSWPREQAGLAVCGFPNLSQHAWTSPLNLVDFVFSFTVRDFSLV